MLRPVFPSRSLPWFVVLPLSFAFAAFISAQPVEADPPVAAPAQLAPATPQNQLVVAQGTVHDAEGKPLQNALVTALVVSHDGKPLPQTVVQTDEQGHFMIEASLLQEFLTDIRRFLKVDEKEFRLIVLVHAPGYAVVQKIVKGSPAKGPDLPTNDISLARGFDATGHVSDADGKAVAGAVAQVQSVQIAGQPMDSPEGFIWLEALTKDSPFIRSFQATSDDAGNFTLHDLPQGTLSVTLTDARFMTQSGSIKVTDKPITPDQVGKFIMRRGAKLSGRVLYPDGKPVVKVEVTASNLTDRNRFSIGTTTTKPDGTYEFTAIGEGKTTVSVAAPSDQWVATNAPAIEVKVGQENKLGDITLERGLLISGYVRDAQTKEPVVGVKVAAQKGTAGDASYGTTDAQGKYQVRVQPGLYMFSINEPPPDFLRSYEAQPEMTIGKDTLAAPEFLLQRGATLSGTAKDDKGQPATGAVISVTNSGPDSAATVDAQGNWTLHGIDTIHDFTGQGKGTIQLRIGGAWAMRGKDTVKLPSPPVALVVGRITLQNVKVRVVTPQGEPVSDATISYQFFPTSATNSWENKTATTNAQGEVVLEGLRPEHALELTASKKGYVLAQKGKISRLGGIENTPAEAGALQAQDIVMSPLNAKIAGRVLDAAGQPATGARVALLSPNDLRDLPDNSVLTDDKGQFNLQGLPQGEVTIGVAKGRAFGVGTGKTNGTIELKLGADVPVPAPQNSEAAFALLERWLQEARDGKLGVGGNDTGLAEAAMTLARYDTNRAQRLMTDDQGEINQQFAVEAAVKLAQSDPQRAVLWGKPLIPLIKIEDARTATKLRLATLAAAADPAWARQVYDEIAPNTAPTNLKADAAVLYARLAGLASALKDPDAEGWLQALTLSLNAMTDEQRSQNMDQIVTALANGDLSATRKWAAQLPPLTQVDALSALISWGAQRNLPVAQQMLSDLDALIHRPDFPAPKPRNDDNYQPSPSDFLRMSRTRVARALLASDARAAQAFVTALPEGAALDDNLVTQIQVRAAGTQDRAQIEAALEAARNDWQSPAGNMAFIASLVSDTLPQLSEQAFKDARDKLANRNDNNGRDGEGGAAYAYARAGSDPAESRLLLESEWRRVTKAMRDGQKAGADHDSNWWTNLEQARALIRAMIPLSVERSDEMLQEAFPLSDQMQWYSREIRRYTVKWLLADAQTRLSTPLPTNDYGSDDEE